MQSTSEPNDVEHLLDVLGVAGLKYQNFQKPSLPQPPQPSRAPRAGIDAAFPLLVAAIPEIAVVAPPHGGIVQADPITTTAQDVPAADSMVASLRRPVSVRTSVPQAQSKQQPLQPVKTQIQGVFDMLRGTSHRSPVEEDSVRGINSIFHRR